MPETHSPIDWLNVVIAAQVALLVGLGSYLVYSEVHRKLDYQSKQESMLQCAASDGIPLTAQMGTYGGAEEVLVCLRRAAIIEETP